MVFGTNEINICRLVIYSCLIFYDECKFVNDL